MIIHFLILLSTCSTTTLLVAAHGFMSAVTIDGQAYKGPYPNAQPIDSIIRQVSDINPVQPATNSFLGCGHDAKPAQLVADANPGSTVAFNWSGGEYQHWPHNTGPMLTYMTNCGSSPCSQFDTSAAQWFKIQQEGRKPNGEWSQADLLVNAQVTITLPSTIAPGNYIIRHEVLSLHNSVYSGGAEFYPACAQLRISGSQTGAPTPDELVSLPGAYHQDDPGILDKDIYTTTAPYQFPGPPIAAFVGVTSPNGNNPGGGGGGGGTTNAAAPSPTTKSTGHPTSTPTPQTSCKLKRNLGSSKNIPKMRRRHDVSTALRNLLYGSHHKS